MAFKMHSGVPVRQGGKAHEKRSQTLSKYKHESIGGPNNGRTGPIGFL
jgi:hypothetical protein